MMPGVGYQAYGHAPGHYHESAVAFGAPQLPFRPPELASARYQRHPHADPFNYTSSARMSDPAFLTPEEEFAHLQKLSNDYEPEVTVSRPAVQPARTPVLFADEPCRARSSASASLAVPSRLNTRMQTPSTGSRPLPCPPSMPSFAPVEATGTAAGEVRPMTRDRTPPCPCLC